MLHELTKKLYFGITRAEVAYGGQFFKWCRMHLMKVYIAPVWLREVLLHCTPENTWKEYWSHTHKITFQCFQKDIQNWGSL